MKIIYGIKVNTLNLEREYSIENKILSTFQIDNGSFIGVSVSPECHNINSNVISFPMEDLLYSSLDYELCVRHIISSTDHPLKNIFLMSDIPTFWCVKS